MKQINLLLTLIVVMACAGIPSKTFAFVDQHLADSIVNNLTPGSPSDTIRQLYDAFDLSMRDRKGEIGRQILNVARRAKDYRTLADQLRQLSSIYLADSIFMGKLLNVVDELPEGEDKKRVNLFVRVEKATGEVTYLDPEERNAKLHKYIKEDITPKNDIYEDIFDLYSTILFLGKESKGNMYHEYMDRLEKLILELPEDCYYIKNLFYTSAAIFYTQNNYPEKAVECDRQLLDQIDELDKMYKAQGRRYRSFDRYRYICYRRMLRNYVALSLDEVKDLYARCARLAEADEEVKSDFNNNGRVTAYRLLAEDNYAGAIPYLKKSLAKEKKQNKAIHRELVGLLAAAADSVGDHATLLSALKEYNNLLVAEQATKSQEALRELQIRYDLSALLKEKNNLEIEKRDMELATDEKLISIVLVSLFVMAIVLMILCRSYFSMKSEKNNLRNENNKLRKSIEYFLDGDNPAGSEDLHNLIKDK